MTDASDIHQGSLFEGAPDPAGPDAAATGPDRPFRLEPRTVDPETCERLNEAEGHKWARRYLAPERAASMARSAKSAVEARLASWVHHPDERVPAALLKNRSSPKIWHASGLKVPLQILKRAAETADEEGYAWTPLLDVIARRGEWPSGYRTYRDPGSVDLSEVPEEERPLHRDVRLHRLIDWIGTQTDPREVEALLAFDYGGVGHLVARHTPCPDAAFVDTILEDPSRADALARNPHLERDHVEQILGWAREILLPDEEEDAGRRGRRRKHRLRPDRSAPIAASTLTELQRQGHLLGDALIDELLEVVTARTTPRQSDRSSRYDARTRRNIRRPAFDVLTDDANDEVTPDHLVALYDAVANDSRQVCRVITHPAATPRVWRHVARDSSLFTVRDRLTQIEAAVADPEVREILSASSSTDVLQRLCEQAGPDELDDRLSDLRRADALVAVRVITSGQIRVSGAHRGETHERPVPHLEAVDREGYFVASYERLTTTYPDVALQLLDREGNRWMELVDREHAFQVAFRHLVKNRPRRAWSRLRDGALDGRDLDPATTYRRLVRSLIDDDPEDARATLTEAGDDWNRHLTEHEYGPLLQTGTEEDHVDVLLALPELRNQPAHRAEIRQQGTHVQRATLCRHLTGETLREVFRELAEDAPAVALELVEDEGFAARDELDAESVLPLLSAEDGDLRTRAIFVTGELDLDTVPPARSPAAPSR